VYGYWTFVVGVLAGFIGITLVMMSNSTGGDIRGAGIGLAVLRLILLLTGPSIRLPLKRSAKMLSYAGALIGLAAVVWFALAFNAGNWGAAFANNESLIIGVYGLGVLVIAAGSVFSLLLMSPREEQAAAEERAGDAEAKRDAASEEVTRQQEETVAAEGRAWMAAAQRDAARDEVVRQEKETAAAEDRAGKAVAERDAARDEIARQQDAAAEQQMESEELTRIKESQSQFELYTDSGGKHRWRLRHDNDNIIFVIRSH
jgi:flagellar biosynthesis GTPase FlhF